VSLLYPDKHTHRPNTTEALDALCHRSLPVVVSAVPADDH
jgi:hypothetical protein